jgi:hypothetical protein
MMDGFLDFGGRGFVWIGWGMVGNTVENDFSLLLPLL